LINLILILPNIDAFKRSQSEERMREVEELNNDMTYKEIISKEYKEEINQKVLRKIP